eukprot:TRINITY_DN7846_c0_g1_i1.p1 TRINITY_DN7846_c0_g1~~TRINITY_DN7846_c0_g1_i1.p1  ORF type:complete len:759 (-),score=243.39 TRINITY_DN7846_c0_g1_i1:257-2503(-)
MAEVRPELNHATNAAVVLGRRALTAATSLDRRAFLPSYHPAYDDERGSHLESVLAPALGICSGINLEYLFSTIDVEHHGAGTKVPLNTVGNIGVLQGTSGDLRPGLPSQMTEMHVPVRALFLVDAPVQRVRAVLARRPELRQLVHNQWVRMVVRDPASGRFFKELRGEYIPLEPSALYDRSAGAVDGDDARATDTAFATDAEVVHRGEYSVHDANMGGVGYGHPDAATAAEGPLYGEEGLHSFDGGSGKNSDSGPSPHDSTNSTLMEDQDYSSSSSSGSKAHLSPQLQLPSHLAAPSSLSLTHDDLPRMPVARRETLMYYAALGGMLLSCGGPMLLLAPDAMNPHGALIAAAGTALSLPVLAFSRRYLHGEHMFGRFSSLCVALLLGFNVVATAPSLFVAMHGWSLFGFASTFLIGAYNDRPTVRNNATFAFAAYRISDFAMLTAAALAPHAADAALVSEHPQVVAAALLLAALFKSSQIPLTSLFVRSMEGPTPASALGYAGLSAHVGVVLLSGTMPLWFPFDWARITLASIGGATALYGSLNAKIRADRKGAVANATSATLGLIFVTLAAGYPALALAASFGHAALRMNQILRSSHVIADTQRLRDALGKPPWPRIVPDSVYRLAWRLRRADSDFHLLNVLHSMSRWLHAPGARNLSKRQQWGATAGIAVLAGAPSPLAHWCETSLMDLIHTHPLLAGAAMAGHFAVSVVLMRFLLLNVLNSRRFNSSSSAHASSPHDPTSHRPQS